ncbi:lipase family protein [Streptomyces sp. NPDC087298]|uniref:lipase family protein n=1 Tax=Streptomyces sp. NPDC087298 TaxID=3365779 RepID=UPI00382CE776
MPGVDLDASTKVGLWGHSEGCATSLWAAQLAAAYAPEPNVVGASGAPPARSGPRPVKKIIGDVDELLAFYDFPAERWVHLRTTKPIESPFNSVKSRAKAPAERSARPRPWRWCSSSPSPPSPAGA